MSTTQLELLDLLPAIGRKISVSDTQWLQDLLRGRDWMTAHEILLEQGLPVHDSTKRRLRLLANGSEGRISGGQKGYKLTVDMSAEEFGHFDSWMCSQETEMKRRRLESHKIFHARTRLRP